jgi:hypothetical protein
MKPQQHFQEAMLFFPFRRLAAARKICKNNDTIPHNTVSADWRRDYYGKSISRGKTNENIHR